MSKRPVLAAYTDTGALDVSCPHCDAQPGQWCVTDDGRPRRVPCVARVCAGGTIPAAGPSAGRDYAEPTHQRRDLG
ncbi:zinc finger domain-containing protein [Mycobacterium shigaense]|uniref:zinc finger domain-containing protein n=1 Tax=Mycobacterium shigaense TaxID=722731 RepID=UPI003D6B53E5